MPTPWTKCPAFVAAPAQKSRSKLSSFSEDMASRGEATRSQWICLAHFGGFGYPSTVIGKPPQWRDEVWESILGHFVQSNPNTMLYADVAYLDEIMGRTPADQAPYIAAFKKYAELDPKFEHVLFGTDWIMLGNQKYADTFTTTVRDFLIRCGLEPGKAELENVMWRNARRFAGLTASATTRRRLEDFYRANSLDASRLTAFD